MDRLRDFIAFARARCHPQMTDAAANDLVDNYLQLRRAGSSRKVWPQSAPQLPLNTLHQDFASEPLQLQAIDRLVFCN